MTHVIQELSRGGGARATIYLAHYAQKLSGHKHQIISLLNPDPAAVSLAKEYGLEVKVTSDPAALYAIFEASDIVQVSWWNSVEMYRMLRMRFPPCRLIGWFHVGGQAAPQVLTNTLVGFFDIAAACSPFTKGHPSLREIKDSGRTAMVYGATDLERVRDVRKVSHSGFNIGYIGTVDFIKMHPRYVTMSSRAAIPDAQFLLCGSGEGIPEIIHQAKLEKSEEKFRYLGYVEDVKSLLGILDVYGYPLREDTYAASEMNLQEVMYAGIPPVVFPYGGVKDLVINNVTGLVATSEQEYADALTYLYQNPSERERIGQNAQEYASRFFGAENAARQIQPIYEKLLQEEKKLRQWGVQRAREPLRPDASDVFISHPNERQGFELFLESLGNYGTDFLLSSFSKDPSEQLSADLRIAESQEVMVKSGLAPYRNSFPNDWRLGYWLGLCEYRRGFLQSSLVAVFDGVNHGGDLRTLVLLEILAKKLGETKLQEELQEILGQNAAKDQVKQISLAFETLQ